MRVAAGRDVDGVPCNDLSRAVSLWPETETETAPAFLHCRIFRRKTGFHPAFARAGFPENALGLAGFERNRVARAGPARLAGLRLGWMQANARKLELWTHNVR